MDNSLTKKQLSEYKNLFKILDTNNDKLISHEELTNMIKKYNIDMTEKDILIELSKFDKDKDLQIDFKEFIEIVTNKNV